MVSVFVPCPTVSVIGMEYVELSETATIFRVAVYVPAARPDVANTLIVGDVWTIPVGVGAISRKFDPVVYTSER
jgi:hypothetical protein